MNRDLIGAHLNLRAVLQNLEDLVRLDSEMAARAKTWDVSIQFTVRKGPTAYVEFKEGICTHGMGAHPHPSVKLFFTSPQHLNAMFDGKGMPPIPLKGVTRLGFLQKDFTALTERLEHYLKPTPELLADPVYMRINTILTLNTALYAVSVLADLEPTCKKVASHTPDGAILMEVLPDGPCAHARFEGGRIIAGKGSIADPRARMQLQDLDVANALLGGQLDAFRAVADGRIVLWGLLPLIDNMGLILDRVPQYLS